jgi:hypothetical protein
MPIRQFNSLSKLDVKLGEEGGDINTQLALTAFSLLAAKPSSTTIFGFAFDAENIVKQNIFASNILAATTKFQTCTHANVGPNSTGYPKPRRRGVIPISNVRYQLAFAFANGVVATGHRMKPFKMMIKKEEKGCRPENVHLRHFANARTELHVTES